MATSDIDIQRRRIPHAGWDEAADMAAGREWPVPLVEEIDPIPNAVDVFLRLNGRPHCLFLDSALPGASLGRYSFVAADPFDFVSVPANGSDAVALLARRLSGLDAATIPGLPPFQGGAAGLFGYDLAPSLERLPTPRIDEFGTPAMAIGLYDVVIAFDHVERRAWIISQGLPETEPAARRRRAALRLREARKWLAESPTAPGNGNGTARIGTAVPAGPAGPAGTAGPVRVARSALAPQFAVDRRGRLTSNFTRDGYLATVRRAIEYIDAGDVFQVNLAQRLLHPAWDDSAALYLRLRERNPAPFAAYFDTGPFQIVSASPERFLRIRDRQVETRPIKGTRSRVGLPEPDRDARRQLLESEKDRAENVMIVDLLRNDLSRACRPESVVVAQLCQLETYEFVYHLVSSVRGRLRECSSALDLLRDAFPGGSITGAPKPRAMEIIAELEPTARGPYCGSLGYLGFDGTTDLNILIRTITAGRGWWQLPVGGGIVAQSDPLREYEETWHKAEGLLRALEK